MTTVIKTELTCPWCHCSKRRFFGLIYTDKSRRQIFIVADLMEFISDEMQTLTGVLTACKYSHFVQIQQRYGQRAWPIKPKSNHHQKTVV